MENLVQKSLKIVVYKYLISLIITKNNSKIHLKKSKRIPASLKVKGINNHERLQISHPFNALKPVSRKVALVCISNYKL